MTTIADIAKRVEASMCMTYGREQGGRMEARISQADWEALLALLNPAVPEPVYQSVERILDEESAWISRPSREVSKRIALAATIAAQVAFTPEGPLN